MNSFILSGKNYKNDVTTTLRKSHLHIKIDSFRYGKDGTKMTIGFDHAPNRFLKLTGREARTLYRVLQKHYNTMSSMP